MAIDPVCKMEVDERTALSVETDAGTVYFCCAHCRQSFLGRSETPAEGPLPILTGPILTGPILTGPILTGPILTGPPS